MGQKTKNIRECLSSARIFYTVAYIKLIKFLKNDRKMNFVRRFAILLIG